MKVSANALTVMAAFNRNANNWMAGSDLLKETGIKSGSLYPLLHNMRTKGLLLSKKENGNASALQRPLKTFYKLSAEGINLARERLEALGATFNL